MKRGYIVVAALFLFFVLAQIGFAACQPVFGGGQSCLTQGNLTIDKTMKDTRTDAFSETPGAYAPNQEITSRLTVQNTSRSTIKNIVVTDTFPQSLTYVSGQGSYNQDTRTVTITIDSLNGSETKTFDIIALTQDIQENRLCSINHAQVTAGKNQATDNIQFCIEKAVATTGNVQPTQAPQSNQNRTQTKSSINQPIFPQPTNSTTPPTGPEAMGIIGLFPIGLAGWQLRKRTRHISS